MGSGNRLTYAGGYLTHNDTLSARSGYDINLVATIKRSLHHRDGDGDFFFRASTNINITRTIVYAHHFVIGRVDTYLLSAGVTTLLEEVFIHLLSDDTDLTMLTDIHLVEVTSVINLRCNDPCQFRYRTLYSGCRPLVTVVGRVAPTPTREQDGSSSIEFGYFLLQPIDILILHRPPAPLSESLIGLCRLIGAENHCILGKAVKVLVKHFLQALSASHQRHEHEHAPEDAKTRKQRTRLVTRQRVEYFSICINVQSHNQSALNASMGRSLLAL